MKHERELMEQIRRYFERDLKMTDQDWKAFSSRLKRDEYSKKHLLLKAGQIEKHLSFVEKGIIRFYVPKTENDLTFTFVFDDGFVSAYDSFLTQQPSGYNIQTLEPTILWRISFDDLQTIYSETEAGNMIGRKASEDLFLKKSKRELSLLNDTPEQRYLKLFSEQPQLIKQIPLKYIASYIGITPQALSRIRKRIS
ncbi:Crp/Fnr family transcriptional regulator [Pedobacter psychrotolerans]|uniref:Crp/Fnr family transcriptional regulator n=1 Tax=Pedobacter psychrotolerans TaxID=1843235 RepID=UPI003F949632